MIRLTTRSLRRRVVAVLIALAAVCVLAGGLALMRAAAIEQGAASLRASVLGCAMQCCAVEGSYPATLEYLEEHYGLTVDHESYVVLYESFASNVLPSVVVRPR